MSWVAPIAADPGYYSVAAVGPQQQVPQPGYPVAQPPPGYMPVAQPQPGYMLSAPPGDKPLYQ